MSCTKVGNTGHGMHVVIIVHESGHILCPLDPNVSAPVAIKGHRDIL